MGNGLVRVCCIGAGQEPQPQPPGAQVLWLSVSLLQPKLRLQG